MAAASPAAGKPTEHEAPFMSPTQSWQGHTLDMRERKEAQNSPDHVAVTQPKAWHPVNPRSLPFENPPVHGLLYRPGEETAPPPPEASSARGLGSVKAPFGRSLNSKGTYGQMPRLESTAVTPLGVGDGGVTKRESVASLVFGGHCEERVNTQYLPTDAPGV